jgi:hypothetical protein
VRSVFPSDESLGSELTAIGSGNEGATSGDLSAEGAGGGPLARGSGFASTGWTLTGSTLGTLSSPPLMSSGSMDSGGSDGIVASVGSTKFGSVRAVGRIDPG